MKQVAKNINVFVSRRTANSQEFQKRLSEIITSRIRVVKVLFSIFDKLKNKIQNSLIRFCFYLNTKYEIQTVDFHFHI